MLQSGDERQPRWLSALIERVRRGGERSGEPLTE